MGSDGAPGGFGRSTIEGAALGTKSGQEAGSVPRVALSGPLVDPVVMDVPAPYARDPRARTTQALLVTPA